VTISPTKAWDVPEELWGDEDTDVIGSLYQLQKLWGLYQATDLPALSNHIHSIATESGGLIFGQGGLRYYYLGHVSLLVAAGLAIGDDELYTQGFIGQVLQAIQNLEGIFNLREPDAPDKRSFVARRIMGLMPLVHVSIQPTANSALPPSSDGHIERSSLFRSESISDLHRKILSGKGEQFATITLSHSLEFQQALEGLRRPPPILIRKFHYVGFQVDGIDSILGSIVFGSYREFSKGERNALEALSVAFGTAFEAWEAAKLAASDEDDDYEPTQPEDWGYPDR
jgi:hypothetical protein